VTNRGSNLDLATNQGLAPLSFEPTRLTSALLPDQPERPHGTASLLTVSGRALGRLSLRSRGSAIAARKLMRIR
jgi:hypothetical protein